MPALQFASCGRGRGLTTRPFAGDDLQVLCALMGAYRIIQMACIVPFWVRVFQFRLHGRNFVGPNGLPSWCVDDPVDPAAAVFAGGDASDYFDRDENGDYVFPEAPKDMLIPFSFYLIVSVIYTVLDIALSMGTWSAASVGTPVEPRGRDKALRSLIWVKLAFMNLLLVVVLMSGIYFVAEGRRTNYGCGDDAEDVVGSFENTPWYTMFCVVMFTYAFELLLWPCIVLNQMGTSMASHAAQSRCFGGCYGVEGRHRTAAACLGGCFKCLQCLSCNKLGGGKIRAQADLRDAAVALMDFFNADENFDIVLSDVWLAFKMLGRVRRERKFQQSEEARRDRLNGGEGALVPLARDRESGDDGIDPDLSLEDLGESSIFSAEDKFLDENAKRMDSNVTDIDDGHDVPRRTMLRHNRAEDMRHLRQAARYSHYALGAYDIYPDALLAADLLEGGRSGVYVPNLNAGDIDIEKVNGISLSSCFKLTELGFSKTSVVYATFATDILATPYCILVDEEESTVVVTIRGTAMLEDLVTDLQFSSSEMNKVGKVCGFDGAGKFAHRGMMAKCKWICNDLKRQNVLARLLSAGETGERFRLMFTGHSLGAGIAAVLSSWFKPTYPELKCYAFCPPGCSVSLNLALECEDYVTSIVVGHDVIPRVRGPNFEMLRFEFLEVLARVRVPKIEAWRDIRAKCRNKDLELRNKRLLYPKDGIPQSDYNRELQSFRETRKTVFDEISPAQSTLNIPGRIIHLVHTLDRRGNSTEKYLPYYDSRQNLREVDLSLEVLKEHSSDNLVVILNEICRGYENFTQENSEEEEDDQSVDSHATVDFDVSHRHNFSSEDRWFICCSRPSGSVTLIPAMLSIAAFSCATVGNNTCALFFREVVYLPFSSATNAITDVAGMSLGLYSYGFEYLRDGEYVLQCSPNVPSEVENDGYIKASRAFAVLSLVVGFPVVCVLGISTCMMLSRKVFRRLALALIFVAFFQAMVFIYLRSDKCYMDIVPFTQAVLKPCRLDTGSKLSIASAVMWFMAAIFTLCLDRAGLVEEQLKFFFWTASTVATS